MNKQFDSFLFLQLSGLVFHDLHHQNKTAYLYIQLPDEAKAKYDKLFSDLSNAPALWK